MSIPTPGKPLLTATERERLIDRSPDANQDIRKRNDLIVRNKLKSWLKNAEDVNFILHHLPTRQISKAVTDEDVYELLDIVKALLAILDFIPVEKNSYNQYIVVKPVDTKHTYYPPREFPKEAWVRLANETDYERSRLLSQYLDIMKEHITPSDNPEFKRYSKKKQYQEAKAAFKKIGLNMPEMEEEDPK